MCVPVWSGGVGEGGIVLIVEVRTALGVPTHFFVWGGGVSASVGSAPGTEHTRQKESFSSTGVRSYSYCPGN